MKAAGLLCGALLASTSLASAPASMPALLADLPDDVLAAVSSKRDAPAEELLDAILAARTAYTFGAPGLRVLTDRRWFETASVSGPGAPRLELRRWPGDTVVAFYEVAEAAAPGTLVPGMSLDRRTWSAAGWTVRAGTLAADGAKRPILWGERAAGSRRVVALGVPGDGGLSPKAIAGVEEAVIAVLRHTVLDDRPATPDNVVLLPDLPPPPGARDERRDAWQVFRGPGFTLGLPPGVRAVRLDTGVAPPLPLPFAAAWLRGSFTDRDGQLVAIGDERRAGYVALVPDPDEGWRAGVAAPLGVPAGERLDEAPLDGLVLEWTGASRAAVSHWKESGFSGDWLVFRLIVAGAGVEIAVPAVSGWRSLALFWIPVTWRGADHPPAPAPIDPAEGKGVHFRRLGPAEKARQGLIEGTLTVGTLRLDVPRGFWPVANLASPDGIPVTLVDAAGELAGTIDAFTAGGAATVLGAMEDWTAVPRPSSRKASAVYLHPDGTCVLVAREGSGYVFRPGSGQRGEAWRRMIESAVFVRATARRE